MAASAPQQQQQQVSDAARAPAAAEEVDSSEPDLDFDEPLGAAQGVIAYSNLDDYYFSGEKAYCFGIYCGFKYQCVEFARRYMIIRQKCQFPQCGPAAEIFAMTTVTNVETGEEHPFIACKNKESTVKPAVGMVLVYPITKKMPVGHVAIISHVTDTEVGIAEQNQESKNWKGKPYGRLVPLDRLENGGWYIREVDPCLDDCSGWLYIDGEAGKYADPLPEITEEELRTVNEKTLGLKCYVPPVVHPKFLEAASIPKRIARLSSAPHLPALPTFDAAACPDAKERRVKLAQQYVALVESHFAKLNAAKKSKAHHFEASGHTYRRAGVPRSGHWQSEYVPSEPLAIGSIGDAHRAFMVVEKCAVDTLSSHVTDPDRLAALALRFDMPVAAARAAAHQLKSAQNSRASVALSAADCLMGTLGMFHDFSTDSNRILHAELDSLNLLIDVNALQGSYAADMGRANLWRMNTYGNDFNRAYKNILKLRAHNHAANAPLVFLDFGTADDLKSKYNFTFASENEAYQYEVERLNGLYFAATLQDFLTEKATDLKNGDLLEKDMPKWSVRIVEDAFAALSFRGDRNELLYAFGERALVAWKCAPWWAIFRMAAAKAGKAQELLDCVCANDDFGIVMQPLWTHVTSHPAFLPHLAAWAAEHDKTAPDGNAVSNRVIPLEAFPGGVEPADASELPPKCVLALPPHQGLLNPDIGPLQGEARGAARASEAPVFGATVFSPAMHLLMAGGKRSAACALEARQHDGEETQQRQEKDDAAATCSIYAAVHPCPLTFIRSLKQD